MTKYLHGTDTLIEAKQCPECKEYFLYEFEQKRGICQICNTEEAT